MNLRYKILSLEVRNLYFVWIKIKVKKKWKERKRMEMHNDMLNMKIFYKKIKMKR